MEVITATNIAKLLKISRSYLYQLTDNGLIEVSKDESGNYIWNEKAFFSVKKYLSKTQNITFEKAPSVELKESRINNRRYLGNKYKLLPFIKEIIDNECSDVHTIADLFSGTGAVASGFIDKKIITNDILYSNYLAHIAWFSAEEYSKEKIVSLIERFNATDTEEDNYMKRNFADTFFSAKDCSKIGFIREEIESLTKKGEINNKERAILITSLLYAMDKIANTVGHYDAYRKNVPFEKELELTVPVLEDNLNENNLCFNIDANELVKNLEVDLIYLDPPYNSRQYCDAYHLIENVARWEKPEVFGVARKMDRSRLKSDYCTKSATKAFEDLIENSKSRYILLSYNNMAQKGNDRSNAKISDEDILRILSKKGSVKIFSQNYKAFTTGKSDIAQNEERLFLCTCYENSKKNVSSPLNYTGGKHKLLSQILPLFPNDTDLVVDLFCGGCNVGFNVSNSKVIFNDNNVSLIGLLNTFKHLDKSEVFERINKIINQYQLSLSSTYGYEYYGCNSRDGLSSYNKEKYLLLRHDVNNLKMKNDDYYLKLYVLIVYAFNNQIRFNKKGDFNLPVGKRDFNNKIQNKLALFLDKMSSCDYTFSSKDFRSFDNSILTKDSFVYVDPPYLISCASYNEQSGWTNQDEKELLDLLNYFNKKDIRFALSNVLHHKGRTNQILLDWLEKHNYYVHTLDFDYSNSNYQKRDRSSSTKEVLITNYKTMLTERM